MSLQIAAAILCGIIILWDIWKGKAGVGLFGFVGLLAIACIPHFGPIDTPVQPTYTYEEVHQGPTGWAMDQYAAHGYAMPKPGERFNWQEYFDLVPEGQPPQEWDLVEYKDAEGKVQGAIVRGFAKIGIIVSKSEGDGVMFYFVVETSAAQHYLRPHKLGQSI